MKKIDYHAKLVVYDLPKMNADTKKRLIAWLKDQLEEFKSEKDYKVFTKRFTARLMK